MNHNIDTERINTAHKKNSYIEQVYLCVCVCVCARACVCIEGKGAVKSELDFTSTIPARNAARRWKGRLQIPNAINLTSRISRYCSVVASRPSCQLLCSFSTS